MELKDGTPSLVFCLPIRDTHGFSSNAIDAFVSHARIIHGVLYSGMYLRVLQDGVASNATTPQSSLSTKKQTGDIGHYYYGPGHPMKPHRLKLAHHLLLSYNLYREMDVYRPHLASSAVSQLCVPPSRACGLCAFESKIRDVIEETCVCVCACACFLVRFVRFVSS